MAIYYAELEYITTLTVRFELDDDLEPTDEDVMYAAGYVENHVDSIVGAEKILYIEKDDYNA